MSGYVAQNGSNGAIGYVEYSYAIQAGFPVAKVLNAAGYYTDPRPRRGIAAEGPDQHGQKQPGIT